MDANGVTQTRMSTVTVLQDTAPPT